MARHRHQRDHEHDARSQPAPLLRHRRVADAPAFALARRLPCPRAEVWRLRYPRLPDLRSEEHTSELQSLMRISYAVFCLKKKNTKNYNKTDKQPNDSYRTI